MDVVKVDSPSAPAVALKPIKLRSACNQCFSAKVRCDGNKSGCLRCQEKNLPCKYSESRVGKVVGKRKKRQIEDSIGTIHSEAWVFPSPSMPSPATTNSSDENKRSCTAASWASFAADDQVPVTWDSQDQQLQTFEMVDGGTFSFSPEYPMAGMCITMNGLPTPSLSPPRFNCLSPMVFENRPTSRQSSGARNTTLLPPTASELSRETPELQPAEDEEMVCIKLLAHLKKHSQSEQQQTVESKLALLQKSNAALRQILSSKTARSDYACQMLLTSIMAHLVTLCERTGKSHQMGQKRKDAFTFQQDSQFFNMEFEAGQIESGSSEQLKAVVQDTSNSASTIADLLKRKPFNGFQVLGRHESLLITLSQRLKVCAASLG